MIDLDATPSEALLMRDVMAVLNRHYPGFLWVVDLSGGLLTVNAPQLSGSMGFIIKMRDFTFHRVVMAGGELLERYRQRRARIDPDAVRHLPRTIRGDAVPLR